jgi:hypothetical protein
VNPNVGLAADARSPVAVRELTVMCQKRDMESVITKLDEFVQGRNTSVRYANEIEGDLAKLCGDRDDDEVIDDFIHDLAFYRPEGGDGLYDYERFKPMAEAALRRLRKLNGENT